ncbi:MAG: helix-turn-helix domain-containing protein [Verrucomicrobiota bacterium]
MTTTTTTRTRSFDEVMARVRAAQGASDHAHSPKSEVSLAQRVGARIERARLMRGHSLRSLAEALEGAFSHTTLQKYEKGELTPELKTLGMLADFLDVRADYFLKRESLQLEKVEYRKLTKLGKKQQKQIEEEAFEFFERYLEIESILAVHPDELPSFDLSGVQVDELGEALEAKAVELRMLWKLGMNPIPNVHSMLEQNGVKVKFLGARKGFDGISAFARAGELRVPAIALSDEHIKDLPRMRFTAIHELAHLVLDLPEMEPRELERACHRFAGAFLVPKERFIEAFGQKRQKIVVAELKAIKAEWGISCAAAMKRALDLGLITEGRHKSFCIMANKWGWRTKGEPGHWAGEEASYRFKQLTYRALAQELITASKACGLLNCSSRELAEDYELAGE